MEPVTFIAFSFARGGAGKAALRIRSLTAFTGRSASGLSIEGCRNDPLSAAFPSMGAYWAHKLAWISMHVLARLIGVSSWTKLSLNAIGSRFFKAQVKASKLLHVNWVNNEALAITDFPALSGKAIITLHDEWFYCGVEHYCLCDGVPDEAYVNGYKTSGTARRLNRWNWRRKQKYYAQVRDVIFTVPSMWMKDRFQKSPLMSGFPVEVIPNPVDPNIFAPVDVSKAREKFGVDSNDFVILFGAVGGGNRVKGEDLLQAALKLVLAGVNGGRQIKVLTFGGAKPGTFYQESIPIVELGTFQSEADLAALYSCADVTVVPSRVEAFGQVAAESQCCGTPVVCFACSGLLDVVVHGQTGYLADPYDTHSLAGGLKYFYGMSLETYAKYSHRARETMIERFSPKTVAWQFENLYRMIEKNSN